MLAGIGARHSGVAAGAARQFSLRSQRQLSSFAANRTGSLRLGRGGYGLARTANNGGLKSMVLPATTVRFASSNSTPTTDEWPSLSSEQLEPAAATTPASGEALSEIDLASIPEKLGYLKELGLDYGWGLSTMVERLLEVLHIYGGLTWCGSAVAAAIIVRVALFRPMLLASDTTAKLSAVKPEMAPIQARMMAAASKSNHAEMMKARQELNILKERHGIKQYRMWVPMLQIPIGFCFFKVMRSMAYLPVPSLMNENVGWITDVTMCDPYYILPIMTSSFMYLSFKRGGEFGMQNMGAGMRKFMQNGLPIISFMFMAWWPGVMQIYFATTGALSLLQTYLMTTSAFRNFMGLSPLPQPAAPEQDRTVTVGRIRKARDTVIDVNVRKQGGQTVHTVPKASFVSRSVDGMKDYYQETSKRAADYLNQLKNKEEPEVMSSRYTKEELEHAKTYEERRKFDMEQQREMLNARRRAEYARKMKNEGH